MGCFRLLIFSVYRYVICQNLRDGTEAVYSYLEAINYQLSDLNKNKPDLDVLDVSNDDVKVSILVC